MSHRIRLGHTAITWANDQIAQAVAAIAAEGYWGTETFGWVLEEWESQNRNLLEHFDRYRMNLTSLYCHLDLIDPSKREDGIRKVMGWVDLYEKYKGSVVIIGGTMLDRRSFTMADHLTNVTATLNDIAQRITDRGLICCFHPHTATPVETEEEIHRVMNAVDTRYVKFAPDTGQIAKGGADPLAFVKEYREIVRIVHLKDYTGGPVEHDAEGREIDPTGFLGYTPLGMGTVDIKRILRYMEETGYDGHAHVELDGNQWSPTRKGNPIMSPFEAIRKSKTYLMQLGYENFTV